MNRQLFSLTCNAHIIVEKRFNKEASPGGGLFNKKYLDNIRSSKERRVAIEQNDKIVNKTGH